MNHWHYGLRPMRRCCADFGSDSNETGWNFHYSIPIGFADISRPPTPPCGRCGSAARSREASALLHIVAGGVPGGGKPPPSLREEEQKLRRAPTYTRAPPFPRPRFNTRSAPRPP